jgi:hypothetical protein
MTGPRLYSSRRSATFSQRTARWRTGRAQGHRGRPRWLTRLRVIGITARRASRPPGSLPEERLGHESRRCEERGHFLCRHPDAGRPRRPALSAVVYGLDLEGKGVAVVGQVPRGLPRLRWPEFDPELIVPLLGGALGVALLSFSNAIVVARSFAAKGRL